MAPPGEGASLEGDRRGLTTVGRGAVSAYWTKGMCASAFWSDGVGRSPERTRNGIEVPLLGEIKRSEADPDRRAPRRLRLRGVLPDGGRSGERFALATGRACRHSG